MNTKAQPTKQLGPHVCPKTEAQCEHAGTCSPYPHTNCIVQMRADQAQRAAALRDRRWQQSPGDHKAEAA